MKRYIKSSHESWKDSWQYQKIKDLGYGVEVSDREVIIRFDDGDVYARFKLIPPDPDDMYDIWLVKDGGEYIQDDFDFAHTYDEIVTGCLNYFLTRY